MNDSLELAKRVQAYKSRIAGLSDDVALIFVQNDMIRERYEHTINQKLQTIIDDIDKKINVGIKKYLNKTTKKLVIIAGVVTAIITGAAETIRNLDTIKNYFGL